MITILFKTVVHSRRRIGGEMIAGSLYENLHYQNNVGYATFYPGILPTVTF